MTTPKTVDGDLSMYHSMPKVCCVHNNSFCIEPDAPRHPCHPYMCTLVVCYVARVEGGDVAYPRKIHGYCRRTLCLPFPPVDLAMAPTATGRLLIVHPNVGPPEFWGATYEISDRDIHVGAGTLAAVASVDVEEIVPSARSPGKQKTSGFPRELVRPYADNICGKVLCATPDANIDPEYVRAGVTARDMSNISCGTEVNTAWGKFVRREPGVLGVPDVFFVGVTHVSRAMEMLSTICPIDPFRPPMVHMAIYFAVLPHSTRIHYDGCGVRALCLGRGARALHLVENLAEETTSQVRIRVPIDPFPPIYFQTADRHTNLQVYIHVKSWDEFARVAEGFDPGTAARYQDAVAGIGSDSLQIFESGEFVARLTHKGSFTIRFSWKRDDNTDKGNLPWTRENVRLIYAKVDMFLRVFEHCT
jgi:hypothetical protein